MASVDDLIGQLRGMSAEDRSAILQAFAPQVPESSSQGDSSAAPSSNNAANSSGSASASSQDPPPNPSVPHVIFPPRLSMFSGETDKDARYSLWRAEVVGLQSSHSESAILQAMRRSTKSLAADVLLHLPPSAKVVDILARFDQMFGCVQPAELQYEQFYTARQRADETIVAWACRLEQIISELKATDKNLTTDASSNMLCSKFWSGLAAPAARDALRHVKDNNATFTELLVAARQLEAEGGQPAATRSSALQGSAASSELAEVLKKLQELNQRIDAMDKRQNKPSAAGSFKGKCHKCGEIGHKSFQCKKSGNGIGQV